MRARVYDTPMPVEWTSATAADELEFIDKLRRATARFCYFHYGGQAQLHRNSRLSKSTIWAFCKGRNVRRSVLKRLADVLPGWESPAPPAVSLKDHMSVYGNTSALMRKTGISVHRLKAAANGLLSGGVSESQKARILAAYPGLITPDSFDAHPDRMPATAAIAKLETLQQMTAPNAQKPKEQQREKGEPEAPPIL